MQQVQSKGVVTYKSMKLSISSSLEQAAFENIVVKGEITHNEHFLLFHKCVQLYIQTIIILIVFLMYQNFPKDNIPNHICYIVSVLPAISHFTSQIILKFTFILYKTFN